MEVNWKSNSEMEEDRKKKIEEIKASTDPSMDEIDVVYIGQEDDIRDGYQMEITKREKELAKLGALDLYELYNERQKERRIQNTQRLREQSREAVRKIREVSNDKELKEKLGIEYTESSLKQKLTTSDGHQVEVVLTQKEKAIYERGGLTQAETDEICYERAPMSFWKIKKAITKFHERMANKETTDREDEGER